MTFSEVLRPLMAGILTGVLSSCGMYTSPELIQNTAENANTNHHDDRHKQISSTDTKHVSDAKIVPPAPFFTYPYSPGPEIQPAIGGTLILKEGCLLLDDGNTLSVPVFPHGITSWDEEKQILTANGVEISLNGELFTNGPLASYEYSPEFNFHFEQEGDRQCLKDRKIRILGSQFIDIND